MQTKKKAASLVDAAAKIASRYRLTIAPSKHGSFVGSSVEMPLILIHGSAEEVVRLTQEALTNAIVALLHNGEQPPRPNGSARTMIVNVRMSEDERNVVEARARQKGYRGVSDFLRSVGLRSAQET